MSRIATCLFAVVMSLLVVACGTVQPTETIGPNNPAAMAGIRAAYLKAGQQKSFRARMVSESGGKISENTIEFAAPGSIRMVMKKENMEQIMINGAHYMKADGRWTRLPISTSNLIEQFRKDPATIDAFERTISGAQIVGPEVVNGKPATAYRYYQSASIGGGLASSTGWVKLWVGANGLPMKLESDAVGRVLGFGSQSKTTITYEDFGGTVRIVAPI